MRVPPNTTVKNNSQVNKFISIPKNLLSFLQSQKIQTLEDL